MVSSPAFNVSMFIWSLPVAVPFFICHSAVSTFHDVISGTSFGSVLIMVICSLSHSSVENSSIHSMILSCSWISLPCLSRSVISLSWLSFCVLRTFFRLFDAIIVFCMISWLYFLMSSLAFVLIVLHISAYSIRCLLSPFSAISHHFGIKACVDDDILDFCGLFIALATLDALCWIVSVMVSLMGSMLSSSCSVSNQVLNSSWNSICFVPIRVASTRGGLLVINFFSTSTSNLMLFITSLWSLPMLTWLVTVTYVTMSGLFVRM